jgi:drug/metabolite transporter (DMT)-like permease
MSNAKQFGRTAIGDKVAVRELPMRGRVWVTFGAVAFLWGIPYLLIRIAVDDGVPPVFVAWVRTVLGAAVLLGMAWRAHTFGGLWTRMKWLTAFAVVEIALPYPLIAAGERHVTSSLTAILVATAPLFVALAALRFDATERPSRWQLAGLVLGLAGIAGLTRVDIAGRADELHGTAAVLGATFCYAVGPLIYKRRLADLDRRASMGASLALAALLLAPAAAIHPPTTVPSTRAIVALLILGLFCTAAALVLWGALIAQIGVGRALVVTYLNPVVAVALGMVILGERPGMGAIASLLLILVSSWLSTDGRLSARLGLILDRLRPQQKRSASPTPQIVRDG